MIEVVGSFKSKHLCDSRQLEKFCRALFSYSKHSNIVVLNKILCDLWGPTLVLSIEKLRYYACLVDDFSKYIWIIPLQHKFDSVNAYLALENYVAR